MDVTSKALPKGQARKLISKILKDGLVGFADPHLYNAMKDDVMSEVDVTNVLRGGQIVEEAEWENEAWRYRLHTPKFCVVVEFTSETSLVVITTWRKKEKKAKR